MLILRHSSAINPRQNGMDLEKEPCPTVMTNGLSAFGDYWIETAQPLNRSTVKSETDKPPYRVPSMAEIDALPWNGFKVASTFSGCGGSCLGYRMAGFRVVWANEFVPAAQASYRANAKADCTLDCRDIKNVRPEEILEVTGLAVGELDLFDGSPPCQAFSTAGKRAKGWGEKKTYEHGASQCNETLFDQYIRLLDGLKPRVFVAENVSGLVKGVAKGYFLEILAKLKACGYRVGCKVLDAQWLGVPQTRQRTIFIGVREDLGKAPAFPKPLPYRYSVRDALPWIVKCESGPTGFGVGSLRTDSPAPTVLASMQAPYGAHTVEAETDISRFAIGKEWDNVKIGGASKKYFSLVKPCPTVLASHGSAGIASIVHPIEKRKFTIAELRRICAFPDDFVLCGSYAQQWERLGNSVPPVMMAAIARIIRDEVLGQ